MTNTNEERIDDCITELIEVIAKDIRNNCESNHSIKPDDEIEALASLIKARATIKSTKSYL
nr:MAG TPA: hypothetical protein [Caudoviricetes sp.]